MLKNLFFQKRGEIKTPETPDEEFQVPFLHRREYTMTAELMRRREEEALRRRYQLSSPKMGMYL
jgi:hypothetical protein